MPFPQSTRCFSRNFLICVLFASSLAFGCIASDEYDPLYEDYIDSESSALQGPETSPCNPEIQACAQGPETSPGTTSAIAGPETSPIDDGPETSPIVNDDGPETSPSASAIGEGPETSPKSGPETSP